MLQHYEFTRSSPYDRAFITGELSIILYHAEMCHNKNLEYTNIFSPFPTNKKSVKQSMSWDYIDI